MCTGGEGVGGGGTAASGGGSSVGERSVRRSVTRRRKHSVVCLLQHLFVVVVYVVIGGTGPCKGWVTRAGRRRSAHIIIVLGVGWWDQVALDGVAEVIRAGVGHDEAELLEEVFLRGGTRVSGVSYHVV